MIELFAYVMLVLCVFCTVDPDIGDQWRRASWLGALYSIVALTVVGSFQQPTLSFNTVEFGPFRPVGSELRFDANGEDWSVYSYPGISVRLDLNTKKLNCIPIDLYTKGYNTCGEDEHLGRIVFNSTAECDGRIGNCGNGPLDLWYSELLVPFLCGIGLYLVALGNVIPDDAVARTPNEYLNVKTFFVEANAKLHGLESSYHKFERPFAGIFELDWFKRDLDDELFEECIEMYDQMADEGEHVQQLRVAPGLWTRLKREAGHITRARHTHRVRHRFKLRWMKRIKELRHYTLEFKNKHPLFKHEQLDVMALVYKIQMFLDESKLVESHGFSPNEVRWMTVGISVLYFRDDPELVMLAERRDALCRLAI